MRTFIEIGVPVIIVALIILCLVLVMAAIDAAECYAKTAKIGFPHHWGAFSGCLIEVKPGQWIPLDSYYFKQE